MNPVYKFAAAGISCSTLGAICVRAHSGVPPGAISFSSWTWPVPIVIALLASAAMYTVGALRMWLRKSHAGLTPSSIACFACGWLSLVAALDSPIHELGEQLFFVHMIQHEILMLISAPLVLLGRPSVVFLWALPAHWRRLARLTGHRVVRTSWAAVSAAVTAWLLHAFALWAWHAPVLFEATLSSDAMHAAQHLSFFVTALLFWWALIGAQRSRLNNGAAVIYVFTTGMHMSILGALLTFAPRPWYQAYTLTAPFWHLSALEDQQLGGLIMWIPAGTILFLVTLGLFYRWMKYSDERWALGSTAMLMRRTANPIHEA
jgi:putative membrane protein